MNYITELNVCTEKMNEFNVFKNRISYKIVYDYVLRKIDRFQVMYV